MKNKDAITDADLLVKPSLNENSLLMRTARDVDSLKLKSKIEEDINIAQASGLKLHKITAMQELKLLSRVIDHHLNI
jgi:hypothetical protein